MTYEFISHRPFHAVALAAATFIAALVVVTSAAQAATITVTNGSDSGAGSLRDALASAANGDTINFDSSVTEVVLTSARLDVSTGVTISGPGADLLTVKRSTAGGTPNFRVFSIVPGAGNTATISGITISNGNDTPGGGISFTGALGTQLRLVRAVVSGNNAGWGGGIDATGNAGSSVTIDSSTISGNTANGGAPGCGFCNGGGMKLEVPTTIVNSTISGNVTPDNGGAMKADSQVTILNSTIAGNAAGAKGGGIWVSASGRNPNLAIKNTLVADNTFGAGRHECDVETSTTSLSVNLNNLIEDGSCNFLWASGAVSGSATGFLSGDPGLLPLANNGGPTKTQTLAYGSIARGAGDSATCAASPVGGLDQRGIARPSPCSRGADDGAAPAPGAPTSLVATPGDGSASIAFTEAAANGSPIINYEYSTDNGTSWTSPSPARTSSPVTIGSLTNGITYQVKLRAINGATGPASSAVSVTPAAPPSPTPEPSPSPDPTPILAPGPSPGPSNTFSIGGGAARTSSRAITTRVAVPGPGRIVQRATLGASSSRASAAAATMCSSSKSVSKAGTYSVTCRLTAAARRAQRRGKVRVSLRTSFTPTGGTARTVSRTVVLPSRKASSRKASFNG